PRFATPWLAVTDLRLGLGLAIAVWLIGGRKAIPSKWEWRTLAPAFVFVGIAAISALTATDYQDEALKFVGRLGLGVAVMLLSMRIARQHAQALLWAIIGGGGLSALLGLGEVAGWPAVNTLLQQFKVA